MRSSGITRSISGTVWSRRVGRIQTFDCLASMRASLFDMLNEVKTELTLINGDLKKLEACCRKHDGLMEAYWGEGLHIGDRDVLRPLVVDAGLDAAEVDDVLDGDAYLDRVRSSTVQAQSLGIDGIPGFVLDEKLLILGAHPPAVFEQAFARLASS